MQQTRARQLHGSAEVRSAAGRSSALLQISKGALRGRADALASPSRQGGGLGGLAFDSMSAPRCSQGKRSWKVSKRLRSPPQPWECDTTKKKQT